MRTRGPGMNLLRCDVPGCDARFYSASILPLIRLQAALAGWKRSKASKVIGPDGNPVGSYRERVDVCPGCQPVPVIEVTAAAGATP